MTDHLFVAKHVSTRLPDESNTYRRCMTRRLHSMVNRLTAKYTVNAISGDNEDNEDNKQRVISEEEVVEKYAEQFDAKSKDYQELQKSMTVWQSIRHLWYRRVNTSDDTYLQQFIKADETGWDRVRLMWSEHLHGEDNPEVRFVMMSAGYGLGIGLLYGGVTSNVTAVQDFTRRHNEYVFRGQFEARRRIRDSMYLQFCSRGFRWSWRMAVFTGTLSALTTTAIAYRNDIYYRDCAGSGAVLCALWKVKMGARAMVVSGGLGALFGLLFAGSVKLALKAMHTSVPEYRHWRHVRYTRHLEVEEYSDGTTEYDWNTETPRESQLQYRRSLTADTTNQTDSNLNDNKIVAKNI